MDKGVIKVALEQWEQMSWRGKFNAFCIYEKYKWVFGNQESARSLHTKSPVGRGTWGWLSRWTSPKETLQGSQICFIF